MSAITYHVIGLNCPDLPRQLMGTDHGVTWFPNMTNCPKCRMEWERRAECAPETLPPMVENEGEGSARIDVSCIKLNVEKK